MASLVGAITTLGLLGASVAAPVFTPAEPVIERPYEATWTGLGLSATPGKRAVSFSKTEVTSVTHSVSDTASISATENPVDTQEISTFDTARLSVTDTAQLFNFLQASDTASLQGSDTVNLTISGVTAKAATDTASLSLTEATSISVTIAVTDTASIQGVDEAGTVTTPTEVVSVVDTASLSVDADVLLNVFVGVVEKQVSDSISIQAIEAATASEVNRIRRITFSSSAPRILFERL